MGFAVDLRGRLAVRRVDEAEHLAGLLVDPVVLVIHAVLALDLQVRFVGSGDVSGLHAGDVVRVQVCRHRGLLSVLMRWRQS